MSNQYVSPLKIAVLGAGVMGSQIAATFANSGFQVALLDLPSAGTDPKALLLGSRQKLLKMKPAPLMLPSLVDSIRLAHFDEDLTWLKDYDLVIEAIAERFDWKEQLYKKIAPHLGEKTILATNTSGLSIQGLADTLPKSLREKFCGIHFFNPPRYMHLVELIPCKDTNKSLLDVLETFLVIHLGKGVVRSKDTPNFIANRIGVFSLLLIFHYTERFNLSFDIVDALTGIFIGHPKSATFRTSDVVGLDTLAHVIHTMTEGLKKDPWHFLFKMPAWLEALIKEGALGQKTGAGIYRKQGKEILVLDLAKKTYAPLHGEVDEKVKEILLLKDPVEKIKKLRQCEHPQAALLWNYFRELFHYCAVHGEHIATTIRDIDLAMKWGFGWQEGPFETWQACGWKEVIEWIEEDIQKGVSLTKESLPQWTKDIKGPYEEKGAYDFHSKKPVGFSSLPVYERQCFSQKNEKTKHSWGNTLFENEGIRLWHTGDNIAIATFKTKNNIITHGVIEGLREGLSHVLAGGYEGLVIWQGNSENFCYGADLKNFSVEYAKNPQGLKALVASFQQLVMALKYVNFPVVAAVRGMVLGGGVEICLHCDRVVAAAETYMGLVEAGVGILPAGGGSKEMALRAANLAEGGDPFPKLKQFFEQIAMAKVSGSALEAKQFHYLRPSDVIVMNASEILYVAKANVKELVAQGYRPPVSPRILVTGRPGIATFESLLVNLKEGHFISPYDALIAKKIATVLCGGEVDSNTVVDEPWLLNLELEEFMGLAQQEKTLERINYTLKTGKPLRN